MSHRFVLQDPNKELRKISEPILETEFGSQELKGLVEDLIETMSVENGIGIAAPQIGVHKRIVIIDAGKDGPQALINPEITSKSLRKIEGEEGCLSVPGVYGIVKRHRDIKATAWDVDGNQLDLKASGLLSVVIQHETDHLDGILFIDKVLRYTSPPRM